MKFLSLIPSPVKFSALVLIALLASASVLAADEAADARPQGEQAADAQQQLSEKQAWAKQFWESLDRKTGEIKLDNGVATLKVPEDFYFLNSADAEKVLTEAWGNPPGAKVLGMLIPAQYTPFDKEAWAVTVEYEEDGYVSDEDADKINYDDMLADMKKDVSESSKERVKQGYEAIELLGWAAKPYYDSVTHKLHWAKELKFGDSPEHTLNYNIRVLGRKGVLVLNFIAGMEQKSLIDANLNKVLAIAEFDKGSTYADFNPELDKVAAYGLGALVAGKLLAKTGFFVVALMFLKKFGVLIVLGIGALFKRFFGKKDA
jgi:uncharacterized membrane-anchored protein